MVVIPRWRLVAALVVAVALVTGGCGKSTKKTVAGTKLTSLGKKLPKAIQDSGVVRVGSDIEYAPIESFKENTKIAQGLDIDVADAMGAKLGVKLRFIDDTDFAGIILALRSGRFDIIMSAMNDTAERRGKGVDFIDYFRAGTSIVAKKGNPESVKSLDDLCGKTVSVQKGTVQETDIIAPQQPKCTAAGKPRIDVLGFEKDTDALQQVKVGRAVADLEDFPVAAYNAKTSGGGEDFEVVGQPGFSVGQYGIAVPKEQRALRDALRAALRAAISDGTYDRLLGKWNLTGGALKTAPLNGGG